jgi:DNA (cytosine-5)-methyltransferase 1
MLGDKRNYLYKLYAEFLNKFEPSMFVFENVTGLISAKDFDESFHFQNMQKLFKDCGYCVEYKVLNASDYGVLQNRRRIILIGKRGRAESCFYPDIPHVTYPGISVSEVLNDLPPLHAGKGSYYSCPTLSYTGDYLYDMKIKEHDADAVTFHIARPHTQQDLQIYKIVVSAWNKEHRRISYPDLPENLRTHHNSTAFTDRFKVVASDLPVSQTIVAHISRDGHYYIHPDIKQNRSLTPREAARLQTFPDNYYFESSKGIPGRTAAFKQIGNAVPVRMAYCVAMALKNQFKNW